MTDEKKSILCDACNSQSASHSICTHCYQKVRERTGHLKSDKQRSWRCESGKLMESLKPPSVETTTKDTQKTIQVKPVLKKKELEQRPCARPNCNNFAQPGHSCCSLKHKADFFAILEEEKKYHSGRKCALPGCDAMATLGNVCCTKNHKLERNKILEEELENAGTWCVVDKCDKPTHNNTRCCEKHVKYHETYYARGRKCKNPKESGSCGAYAIPGSLFCSDEHEQNYKYYN
jgi:hypothetical protein